MLLFDVTHYVENHVENYNRRYNLALKVYEAPVYEEVNGLVFIYFTTRCDDFTPFWKRYHQVVTGCVGLEVYYEASNVIDIDKNFPLSDLRLKFKYRCMLFLQKME
jgi:hypothetical protein